MIKRVPHSYILIFLLLSSAVHAQSSLPPPPTAVFPNYNGTLPNKIQLLNPTLLALICVFLFVGCFCISLRRSATTANFQPTQPQGIDPELLNTFPILPSSAVKQLKFGSASPECAVCLTEFDHRDKLRLLPKCNHVFHSKCIDIWLASHVTCPVCRVKLKPAEECPHRGGNEFVIVIPNEVLNLHHVLDESCVSVTEVNSGDRRSLGRCHSTGHSVGLGKIGMKNMPDWFDLRSEDEKKQITVHHGGIRRSVSHDVFH
ncbi:hypothetical protein K1719_028331 [Acacia pycnantha]|nr:hypothetical protein K1719_028331 [Acacia pycnantha]